MRALILAFATAGTSSLSTGVEQRLLLHSWFDPLQRWKLPSPPNSAESSLTRPLLAYIPGLDGSNGSPFPQFPRLAELFELRAQDVSDSSSASQASFQAIVDDVAAYLLANGSPAGNVVMGESMGGVVAAGLALRYPQLVSGLILVNPATALSAMPELQEDLDWMKTTRIPEPLFPLALFAKIGRKVFDSDFVINGLREVLVERKMEALRAEDPGLAQYYDNALEALVGQLSAVRPSEFWLGRLQQLEQGCAYVEPRLEALPPTLVVAGTADALLLSEKEASRLTGRIPTCDVHLVEGAGHAGTLDQRVDLPGVISEWISKRNLPLSLPAELSLFGVAMPRPRGMRS